MVETEWIESSFVPCARKQRQKKQLHGYLCSSSSMATASTQIGCLNGLLWCPLGPAFREVLKVFVFGVVRRVKVMILWFKCCQIFVIKPCHYFNNADCSWHFEVSVHCLGAMLISFPLLQFPVQCLLAAVSDLVSVVWPLWEVAPGKNKEAAAAAVVLMWWMTFLTTTLLP